MMLLLEIRHPDYLQEWRQVGIVKPGESGSLSNNTERGRDVIHFAASADGAIIERSIAGVDQELGDLRLTCTVGMERLATLAPGESYELALRTDRMPAAVPLRFRCEASA